MGHAAAEIMDPGERERAQLERLRRTVRRVAAVPFYRDALAERGVLPDDLTCLADLRTLPFTTKDDLRRGYPFGFLTVPREEIVRVHTSSGTTGKPVVAGYTRQDLDLWAEVMARTLRCAGVDQRDVLHNAYGYGLFTGGLGFHLGAEAVGATVVPASGGVTKRQVMLLVDLGATVLTCTPSYALVIAETAREMGVDLRRDGALRVGIFGAEAWSGGMHRQLEEQLGLEAFDIYGLTEIIGPGVAVECSAHQGLHIAEDHFLPEVVDPDTGEPLAEGETGELVLTTLTKEGMPLLRFRTRDRTALHRGKCACGRTLVRMDPIRGRTDDMLVVRGMNLFPSQVEELLLADPAVGSNYLLVVERKENRLDQLEIQVELHPEAWAAGEESRGRHEHRLSFELRGRLGISARVVAKEPGSLPRSEGKAKRVADRRELG
ncbi:MAG: phenylacetate--CoA ligase [Thermaerobacter sp.]|nr:phenylacetate--CoA ligase [Thermaerobacter sp.]